MKTLLIFALLALGCASSNPATHHETAYYYIGRIAKDTVIVSQGDTLIFTPYVEHIYAMFGAGRSTNGPKPKNYFIGEPSVDSSDDVEFGIEKVHRADTLHK